MDIYARLVTAQFEVTAVIALVSLLVGLGILVFFIGMVIPSRGKPRQNALSLPQPRERFAGVQARLDKAQIEISAAAYVKKSLTMGIPLGLGLFILVGSVVLVFVGVAAGFLFAWTQLEQERDRKQVRYAKQLASACDTIRTAYGVNPSLKKALEAVATYGQSPSKEDFQEILVATNQERFVEGLQAVADRRRSIVFDTISSSLVRANEATGEVGDMLQRLAESTRQNVAAFEDALTSQINARSNIQWGTYGPWLIFCVFRVMTLIISFSLGGGPLGPMTGFFATFAGNVISLVAAIISILVYRQSLRVSQRGLVVRRVVMSDTGMELNVRTGQRPMSNPTTESTLNAQTRPVTMG